MLHLWLSWFLHFLFLNVNLLCQRLSEVFPRKNCFVAQLLFNSIIKNTSNYFHTQIICAFEQDRSSRSSGMQQRWAATPLWQHSCRHAGHLVLCGVNAWMHEALDNMTSLSGVQQRYIVQQRQQWISPWAVRYNTFKLFHWIQWLYLYQKGFMNWQNVQLNPVCICIMGVLQL